ncbi:MAG: pyridoxamine 5'-phosphate oxidase family protein, partial [Eubacteriales bacterium]|nr:pyridoxamine 5'-phosphate oxidase family protein [Eubacteriales bacterium]
MRRKDREIQDFDKIIEIIDRCKVIRLGLVDEGEPYIVPLNFGYEALQGKLTLYFHSAKQGRKIDIIKANNNACFEADNLVKILEGDNPCDWTAEYESVIGTGKIIFIEDEEGQREALDAMMKHLGFVGHLDYPKNIFSRMRIFKMEVDKMSGKSNRNSD